LIRVIRVIRGKNGLGSGFADNIRPPIFVCFVFFVVTNPDQRASGFAVKIAGIEL
jgi:hypothetical protein